ncbi:MAG: hypothetical protein KDD70_16885 [Bdellovibrionales bacterium]|nr:hypothetical protein [Bdellovibrionales bacterium]
MKELSAEKVIEKVHMLDKKYVEPVISSTFGDILKKKGHAHAVEHGKYELSEELLRRAPEINQSIPGGKFEYTGEQLLEISRGVQREVMDVSGIFEKRIRSINKDIREISDHAKSPHYVGSLRKETQKKMLEHGIIPDREVREEFLSPERLRESVETVIDDKLLEGVTGKKTSPAIEKGPLKHDIERYKARKKDKGLTR